MYPAVSHDSDTPPPPNNQKWTHRTPRCSCGTRWRQVGNQTGHCSACHLTFGGLDAFDRHRQDVAGRRVCLDPAEATTRTGRCIFVARFDGLTTVWGTPSRFDSEPGVLP